LTCKPLTLLSKPITALSSSAAKIKAEVQEPFSIAAIRENLIANSPFNEPTQQKPLSQLGSQLGSQPGTQPVQVQPSEVTIKIPLFDKFKPISIVVSPSSLSEPLLSPPIFSPMSPDSLMSPSAVLSPSFMDMSNSPEPGFMSPKNSDTNLSQSQALSPPKLKRLGVEGYLQPLTDCPVQEPSKDPKTHFSSGKDHSDGKPMSDEEFRLFLQNRRDLKEKENQLLTKPSPEDHRFCYLLPENRSELIKKMTQLSQKSTSNDDFSFLHPKVELAQPPLRAASESMCTLSKKDFDDTLPKKYKLAAKKASPSPKSEIDHYLSLKDFDDTLPKKYKLAMPPLIRATAVDYMAIPRAEIDPPKVSSSPSVSSSSSPASVRETPSPSSEEEIPQPPLIRSKAAGYMAITKAEIDPPKVSSSPSVSSSSSPASVRETPSPHLKMKRSLSFL